MYFRHVLKKELFAKDVATGQTQVDTFGTEKIDLTKKEDGGVEIAFDGKTATVVTPDIKAKNGVIHEIDTIIGL